MASAQVVETSVNIMSNNPSIRTTLTRDNHNLRTYDMTPGFKPFTIVTLKMAEVIVLINQRILNHYRGLVTDNKQPSR